MELNTHKALWLKETLKARLHMRFLMRFLMRFRVQNVPDPTLHESLFREASCGLERKVSHIIWRHPSFEFLPTWRYFVAALRDYKPVRGRLGQVLCAKTHQNRTKIASKIACVNGPWGSLSTTVLCVCLAPFFSSGHIGLRLVAQKLFLGYSDERRLYYQF